MGWYNSNWQYRMKITIDHSQVSGDLTDFPFYINLADASFADLHASCKSDGSDLVLTGSDGTTKLKRDLAHIDTTAETGELYVKINISSSVDTELYLYYGYSSATETNDSDTWRSEYVHVVHGEDSSPTTTVVDSSQTANDGVGTTVSSATAELPDGDGIYANDVSGNNVVFPDTADYDVTPDISITVSWTIEEDEFQGFIQRCNSGYPQDQIWTYHYSNSGGLRIRFDDSTAFASAFSPSINTWYRTAVTFSDSNNRVRHYNAGAQIGSDISCSKSLGTGDTDLVWFQEGDGDWFEGTMHEVRIYAGELTADWIEFEYDNIDSFSTVASVGAEEEPTVSIEAGGIASAETFGAPSIESTIDVSPSGISSAETFGSLSAEASNSIQPFTIGTKEAFGAPSIESTIDVSPSGISSAETFGAPSIESIIDVSPSGISSAETFGAPSIALAYDVIVSGISSAESFGSPSVVPEQFVSVSGIPSGEDFGGASLGITYDLSVSGIPSEEDFGSAFIYLGAKAVFPSGISSEEAFGDISLSSNFDLHSSSIPSGETFGASAIEGGNVNILVPSVPSSEAFGATTILWELFLGPGGIGSEESFGLLRVYPVRVTPLQSQFETDIEDTFLNDLEFAEMDPALYKYIDGTEIELEGIFDREYLSVDPDTGASVQSSEPMFWCQSRKLVREVKNGDLIRIRGAWFQIIENQPDGTGITQLILHKGPTV